MGLTQGAAQTLIEYTDANPRQAVYHWLKLLAIYRDSGQRKDFEETAEKLRKFFNIQAAGTASADPGDVPTLESFPRIAEQVGSSGHSRRNARLSAPPAGRQPQRLAHRIPAIRRRGIPAAGRNPQDECRRRQGDASQRSTT
jgi:hypothetical protein